MSETIIKVEGLGKKYLIGHESGESYTAMRDVITNGVKSFGKNIKKLFATDGSNSIAGDRIEEFWALKDLNFEIKQGDAIGIIGRNGAGKSTLLKVLSRITEPSKGRIEIKGRMASLLEVGTGFHPELSGRENIYLNGAILGMARSEIKRKFDEIVDFSGVEKFLDTPVKRYSSGMYVRLAFSVAAHLESEILVVDEVLAVGDAEFQKKCLGKMGEVSSGQGKTVLFVSHNMQAINALCPRSILLRSGQLVDYSSTSDIVKSYLSNNETGDNISEYRLSGAGKQIRIESIEIEGDGKHVDYLEPISMKVVVRSTCSTSFKNLRFSFGVGDDQEKTVFNSFTNKAFSLEPNETKRIRLTIPGVKHIMPGNYVVGMALIDGHLLDGYESKDLIHGYPSFQILPKEVEGGYQNVYRWKQGWGSIVFDGEFQIME